MMFSWPFPGSNTASQYRGEAQIVFSLQLYKRTQFEKYCNHSDIIILAPPIAGFLCSDVLSICVVQE